MFLFWVKKLYDILLVVLNQSVLDNISTNMKYYYIFKKHSGDDPYIPECQPRRTEMVPEKTQDISELWCITHSLCSPVWILTLCSLEVNWSLTVNTCPFSISLDLGSLVRIRCVGFPHAKDCNARTNSRSGISVSCWISCRKKEKKLALSQKLWHQYVQKHTYIKTLSHIMVECSHIKSVFLPQKCTFLCCWRAWGWSSGRWRPVVCACGC